MPHKKLLLENLQLKRWYDNVSRASELTAEVNLRRSGLQLASWCIKNVNYLNTN
jgi:hypothetical protein